MASDKSELKRYYERFNRDHQRLRGELLESLPSRVAGDRPSQQRFREWLRWPKFSKRRSQLTGLAAAAFAAVLLSIVASRDGGASITFANVMARVERARSVQYARELVKPAGVEQPIRVFVLGRYLERQEHLGPNGDVVAVFIKNLQTGTYVAIDPRNKQFTILGQQRVLRPDGSEEVSDFKAAPSADIFKLVEELPPDAVPAFSDRVLDGRSVIGFYREYRQGVYDWKITYWVDSATMLPVRMETTAISNNELWGTAEWVRSDFVFDEELDPKLFSTEPPAGYQVLQGEIQGIEMPAE